MRYGNAVLFTAGVVCLLGACGADNTGSKVTAPGEEASVKATALEAGADAWQQGIVIQPVLPPP